MGKALGHFIANTVALELTVPSVPFLYPDSGTVQKLGHPFQVSVQRCPKRRGHSGHSINIG